MKREEFYQRLFAALTHFNEEEKKGIREYYEELICDGMENGQSEEEVIDGLESPEDIAKSFGASGASSESVVIGKNTEGIYESGEGVQKVVVRTKERGIQVEKSPDDRVHIYCVSGEQDEIICHEQNGVFFFQLNVRKSFRFFDFQWMKEEKRGGIRVEIPESIQTLEITNRNAKVDMGNLELEKMDVYTSNAAVCCAACQVKYLKTVTSNGGIVLQNLKLQEGDISTSNAKIHCNEIQAQQFLCKTSNGVIHLERLDGGEKLDAKSSNAPIKVDEVKAKDIRLVTSNSPVYGSLDIPMGEYDIQSHTSNGKNSLPGEIKRGQGKTLVVKTSNSKIAVDFTS